MSFVFERDDQWSEEDARRAAALELLALPWHGSVPRDRWLIDRDRDLTFFCFAVGAWGIGALGKYVLYIQDTPVRVFADCYRESLGDTAKLARYVINTVFIPDELATPKEKIVEYLREAFDAEGHSYTASVARVEVEFRPGAVL